jgi:hypothetical protein
MRSILCATALIAFALGSPAEARSEKRCGWYINPTPGNHILQDADDLWWIAQQGSEPAPGFNDAAEAAYIYAGPTMRSEWVEVNGSYGYGCACLEGNFGPIGSSEVRSVSSMRILRLAKCEADPNLPPP